MSRYITEEDAIKALVDYGYYAVACDIVEEKYHAEKALEKAPTADVRENVHGEWIRFRQEESQPWHIKCSNCGQYWSIADHAVTFKFCFNCGADMRGEKDD